MRKQHPPQQLHIPVLLKSTLDVLQPQKGEKYLDLTAGYGGHARAFIAAIGDAHLATLVDRDEMAISELQPLAQQGARLLHTDFKTAAQQLVEAGETFDIVLVDLGVSSPQLDRAERGFSFQHNGPLDMRMDQREQLTAERLVNTFSKEQLVNIIVRYGEEPPRMAGRIAEAIIRSRPHHTTAELATVIAKTYRGGYHKIHPATRTFQALRIALNNELEQVESTLPLLPQLLTPGGRVGVISFHSLEDRLVKRYFAEADAAGYEAELKLLTKKPILGATDDVHNPRSRSAKLRAAVKIKI
ncbi:MAG TPA: 16S rRNA (cytosine(1402)-N(4))-methyltransferase RsmH [Verrucomicrobiae bacterium]|nr:16S rRNA (cytosine(1402)-N(4))-methyltransferase RsmH [Verrucomicrobiae bacterium]